ncbi:hypothetical protein BKA70DRAFT_1352816 [Coprinopsis sp. MPI-PUGE-AT-0042]|nr:hypothetical protein BKA70DRAFT_1352816 [Coprinopsis sp. MPI-PUGE-AT-0042]
MPSMIPALDIDGYITNNEPPPEDLCASIPLFLNSLDKQHEIYEQERRRTEEAIQDKVGLMYALEHEIQRLQSVEGRIRGFQVSLKERRRQTKAILSPIRSVPPEVIGTIIAFAIIRSDGYVGREERKIFQRLRCISRVWRQTAFSTPELWRTIHFECYPLPWWDVPTRHITWFTIASWLTRGGRGAPLNISFRGAGSHSVSQLLDALSSLELNLTSLSLSDKEDGFGDPFDLKILASARARPLPIQVLTAPLYAFQFVPPQPKVNLNQSLPHLVCLTLAFTNVPPVARMPFLTHTHLSELRLSRGMLAEQDVKFVLGGLPQLQVLDLHNCHCTPSSDSGDVSLYTHPSIEVIIFTEGVPETFLRRLVCPRLTDVRIDSVPPGGFNLYPGIGQSLGSFIDRCGGPIAFRFFDQYPSLMLRNVFATSSNITTLYISVLSALEPPEPQESDDPGDWEPHFLIPSSVTHISFLSYAERDKLEAYFHYLKAREHDVEFYAPHCGGPGTGGLFGLIIPTRPSTPDEHLENAGESDTFDAST